jgi:hypothetical protein
MPFTLGRRSPDWLPRFTEPAGLASDHVPFSTNERINRAETRAAARFFYNIQIDLAGSYGIYTSAVRACGPALIQRLGLCRQRLVSSPETFYTYIQLFGLLDLGTALRTTILKILGWMTFCDEHPNTRSSINKIY